MVTTMDLVKLKHPSPWFLIQMHHALRIFFKNLNKILKNTKNFHIIGCLNSINQKEFPAGFFDKHQNFKFKL